MNRRHIFRRVRVCGWRAGIYIVTMAAILISLLVFTGCNNGSDEPGTSNIAWDNYDQRAEQFVMAIVNGDYSIAAAGFDSTMSRALGARGLRTSWESMIKEAGAFVSVVGTEKIPNDEYDIYHVVSKHENTNINTRIVFSSDGKIAGLFFSFVENNEDWDMSPVQRDGYTEIPVIVGAGTDYPLRGIITMPDNIAGRVPAVVLVHGSGPLDMDETVYGITVFKDIAEYLAENGIAVIRYDKRTYTHGAKIASQYGNDLTVWEETIEDAILAKDIIAQDERIDIDRIFALGHSLGGMLTPRLVSEGGFAGGIIMAGSPRSLLDIIYDQNIYFIDLMDIGDDERAALIEQVNEARESFFAMPESYIREMDGHPAGNYLISVDKPFLIMQGGKDFQVYADVDFALYREIADGRGNISLRLYNELNHLFTCSIMDVPTIDDYVAGTSVDSVVLFDIVTWLNELHNG